ncbi:nuclear transport factor 2 family protein [Gordonia sp. TBRC 11910]|uniref:Nuclear transport factor 2 family protein n=1 Tax=Gordonia asplenii TaxID=2725283 RepID=A0A848KUS4_9ACTN|nr:nuclear transport factor 2 family protein [Gordonia asplenii]NMO01989.1 nuclear transport factor 2 family protein [Gordonia asplenii]
MTTIHHPTATEVFAVIDGQDLDTLGDLFTDNGSLVFGNNPAMVGPEQIRTGVREFYATVGALAHTILNEWTVGEQTIVELSVTYHRLDGQQVTIPVVSIWRLTPTGKIDDYRVYFDLAPVYA